MACKTLNKLLKCVLTTLKWAMIIGAWIVLAISVILVGTPGLICLAVLMIFAGAAWALEKLQKINGAYDDEPDQTIIQNQQLKNDGPA